jgi:pilus assembly protein CpaE
MNVRATVKPARTTSLRVPELMFVTYKAVPSVLSAMPFGSAPTSARATIAWVCLFMAKTLSLLRRVYACIVIDMSSHLNDINLAFLDASDAIIEIVTYDSTTIHNTVAMADTFRSIGYPASKVRYLVNRADSPGGIDPLDLERALGRVPEHQVMSDGRLVVQSNNEGVPFVLASPDAQISQDVMRIAGELLNSGRVAAAAGRS